MRRTTRRRRPASQRFRQGIEHLGWREGHDLRIDYRFAPASPEQAQILAKELVALRPDVLVGNSTPATAALLRETHTIPIVFVGVSDPVGSHVVTSIARPGGSATGFTNFEPSLIGKWLEMLKEIAPGIARAAVIFNPKTAPGEGSFFLEPFEGVARSLAVEPISVTPLWLISINTPIGALIDWTGRVESTNDDADLKEVRIRATSAVRCLYPCSASPAGHWRHSRFRVSGRLQQGRSRAKRAKSSTWTLDQAGSHPVCPESFALSVWLSGTRAWLTR
jgi:hypothetical protein